MGVNPIFLGLTSYRSISPSTLLHSSRISWRESLHSLHGQWREASGAVLLCICKLAYHATGECAKPLRQCLERAQIYVLDDIAL